MARLGTLIGTLLVVVAVFAIPSSANADSATITATDAGGGQMHVTAEVTSTTWAAGEVSPVLSSEPLKMLSSHGRWSGLSISGRAGSHPIGRPHQFLLSFVALGTSVTEGSFEGAEEHAVPGWSTPCNGFSADLEATAVRFLLSGEISTRKKCSNPAAREERWLSRFFAGDPYWKLVGAHLVLTAYSGKIVLGHRLQHH